MQYTILHCTALHCPALHCTALHFTALHCTALHCTALHCTKLHCTALHCTALHCTALHCTALHCTEQEFTAMYCNTAQCDPGRVLPDWIPAVRSPACTSLYYIRHWIIYTTKYILRSKLYIFDQREKEEKILNSEARILSSQAACPRHLAGRRQRLRRL